MIDVGIVGVGTYLPEKTMKAAEIARLTNGVWSEDAVINKLGIKQRYLPGPDDGTQEMGAKAALKCLENTGVDPKEIDVILCIGEEWKEYPLLFCQAFFNRFLEFFLIFLKFSKNEGRESSERG